MKEDIEQLRKLIRELDLQWLDEELEEIIQSGKLQQKDIFDNHQKTSKGIEQISYTDKEQLDIILSALKNYFITLPIVQNNTEKSLKESLKINKITFLENRQDIFDKIDMNTQKLGSLLNEINK